MSQSKVNKPHGFLDGFFSTIPQPDYSKGKAHKDEAISNTKFNFDSQQKLSACSIKTPLHLALYKPQQTQNSPNNPYYDDMKAYEKHGDYFVQNLHDMSLFKSKEKKNISDSSDGKIKANINTHIDTHLPLESKLNHALTTMPEQIAKSFNYLFSHSFFNTSNEPTLQKDDNKSLTLAKDANWKVLNEEELFNVFRKQIKISFIDKIKEDKLLSSINQIEKLNSILKYNYTEQHKIIYEREVLIGKTLPLLLEKFNKLSFFHQDIKPKHLDMLEEALNDILNFLFYLKSGANTELEQSFEEVMLFVKNRYHIENNK